MVATQWVKARGKNTAWRFQGKGDNHPVSSTWVHSCMCCTGWGRWGRCDNPAIYSSDVENPFRNITVEVMLREPSRASWIAMIIFLQAVPLCHKHARMWEREKFLLPQTTRPQRSGDEHSLYNNMKWHMVTYTIIQYKGSSKSTFCVREKGWKVKLYVVLKYILAMGFFF